MFDLVDMVLRRAEPELMAAALVFFRVGAIAAFLPGIGEAFLPARIRLIVALSLTVLVFPAIDRSGVPAGFDTGAFVRLALAEAALGLLLGLAVRLVVLALQFAGSIAAQTTALAQIAGPGVAPEPMPAIGNSLLMAGLALALVLDLPARAIAMIIRSYDAFGFGAALDAGAVADWGTHQAAAAFALGFALAGPFLVAAFLYNLALGIINRAMPQLMVAFVGAPAITAVTLLLLLLSGPVILEVWHGALADALAAPLDFRE